ncbi:MAG: PLP-dependent aminotransferase family protein [Candidatus Velthaea sp.]
MSTFVGTHRFAQRAARLKASTIREMLKVTLRPDVISFAGGLPAPELFPAGDIANASVEVMRERGAAALQYSVTEGIPEMREWVAGRLNGMHGTAFTPDDVIITGGSQQALDLFAKIFLDPGDAVVLENPSYLGAIQAFDAYEPRYLPVDTDAHGIVPAALAETLARERPTPKFLYLTPNYQNPTGVTLTLERRREIAAICERFGLPVLEDDPYGELTFGGAPVPPIVSLGSDAPVTYSGTGSKMVAPGLRVAWMVIADREVREKIVPAKQGVDLHTGSFAQYVFHRYVTTGDLLERHLARVRETYAARRDAMAGALRAFMPAGAVRFVEPTGGMFFWVTADPRIDTEELFAVAAADGVVFVPGRPFYPCKDRGDGMRLNFSNANEERIRTGIERLAEAVRASLA